MIWHNELVQVPNQPAGSTVRLMGVYNPPEERTHAIEIKIDVDDAAPFSHTLYIHNPSGLAHEEPDYEGIQHRYNSKIVKARQKLVQTQFQDLKTMRRL